MSYALDFSRTRLSLRRPLTSYSKFQSLYSQLIRNRLILSNRRARRVARSYLNAGCGPNIATPFLNLDYLWHPGIDLCWDLTARLPFPNASFRGIFTEHCLEHIPRRSIGRVLAEFHRLLEPHGTLRIVVPNALLYLESYVKATRGLPASFPYVTDPPPPGWTPIDAVNAVFRDHGHQYAYDFACLDAALRSTGFCVVAERQFRSGRDQALLLDSESRAIESLYVEAWTT